MQVSESGAITWATQSGVHSGEYTAGVVVTDSLGASATQQFKVVVDGAPVVESIDAITLRIGGKVKFTVAATDPEEKQLIYKALNNPDGFKGNARNGLNGKFIFATKNATAGEYKIDIEVADVVGLKSVVPVLVTIKSNLAPTVEPLDSVVVNAGGSMQVQVVSDDVDDDNETLRYLLENAPAGMQVSGEGLIQWSVDNEAETATYSVTVIVLDAENAMGKQVLVVTVDANKAPAVEPIEPIVVKVGDNVGFTISATDSGGGKLTYKALNKLDGFKAKIRNGYKGVFLWYTTKASAGNYKIDIEVTDAGGLKTVVAAQITLEPETALTLLSAPAVVGPFAPEAEAVIDEDAKTITAATSGGMRFYRLLSGDDTKLKITSIVVKDDKAVMNYKTADE
jgi:plastocyanin